ncbi:carbonic anhydrase 12-like [Engraulis encrasicolus]|uniref:carbonic anhydrase 12-like n=1 Tax=Engraulis encrasicolus TaxID=184585 RepID=UPI002FCF3B3D
MVDRMIFKKLLSVLLVTLVCTKVSTIDVLTRDFCYSEHWCEPAAWEDTFFECADSPSKYPSPVNLNPSFMERDATLTPLEFVNFSSLQGGNWVLKNIRNTVALEFNVGMQVKGASLPKDYETIHATFHWGSYSNNGSEHTYNNRRYPMEMQIYSSVFGSGYADLNEALTNESSSVLVMSVFVDIAYENNPLMETVVDGLHSIPFAGDQVAVTPFILEDFLPNNTDKYYQYQGALTYPDCMYKVEWIIFEEPIYISEGQYFSFYSQVYYNEIADETAKLLINNFRPVHRLGNRIVRVSPNATIPVESSTCGLSANIHLAVLLPSLVSVMVKLM